MWVADCHDVAEILLKVALNTITHTIVWHYINRTSCFLQVKFGSDTLKTDVFKKSLNPHWNSEWFKFEVRPSTKIKLLVAISMLIKLITTFVCVYVIFFNFFSTAKIYENRMDYLSILLFTVICSV
jgi:hypothetical protein